MTTYSGRIVAASITAAILVLSPGTDGTVEGLCLVQEGSNRSPLQLSWRNNLLQIRGSQIPG
ncbi:MAG: hypothetical protein NZ703_13965, partial [Gemmataceae bacterium]|nr:hypothetical protein [Gemmataceae bacterium]